MNKACLEKVLFVAMALFALAPITSAAFADNALRVAVITILVGIFTKQFTVEFLKDKFVILALSYWLILLCSALLNPNITTGLKLTWQRVFEMGPFFILMNSIRRKTDIYCLINVFICAMLTADVYYIWQFFTKTVISAGGITDRPSGFYWEDWFMQIFLIMTIPVCVIVLNYLSEKQTKAVKMLAGITLALSFIASILSFARGVWITVVLFLVMYAIIRLYNQKKLLIAYFLIGIFLIVGSMAMFPGFKNRVHTLTDMKMASNANRMLAWKSSWNMFLNNPILGVGQGNWYNSYVEKYIDKKESEKVPNAHNNYMQIIAETGILGIASYLALMFSVLAAAIKKWRDAKNNDQKAGALLMFFAATNFLVIGTIGDFKDTRTVVEVMWYVIGIGFVLAQDETGEECG